MELKELRAKNGFLKQLDFAAALGLAVTTVAKCETGNSTLLSKTIRALQGKLFEIDHITYEPPKNSSNGYRIHKFKDTTRKNLYDIPI